jgi:hypothetical protein
MAVVVIGLMIAFIGGTYLSQLGRKSSPLHQTVAYFGQDEKITNYDLADARRQLGLLKMLQADLILKSISIPVFDSQDFRGLFLGELLFAERASSAAVNGYIKQIARENQYRISNEQVDDIYKTAAPAHVYWLLLKKEARRAGIKVSNEQARNQLARIIPQISSGSTYANLVGAILNQQRISEDQLLETFGDLLAVFRYARIICSGSDVTDSQVRHSISSEVETIGTEFVKIDSSEFMEFLDEPAKEEIAAQFERYKKFPAGRISEQNPYGFGYKIDDRVQFEYIAVKIEDVARIVTAPTQTECEQYYQKNIKQFIEQVPSDPNDPNSLPIERTRSYAEMAEIILNRLLVNRVESKAEQIIQDVITITEAGYKTAESDLSKLSDEQLKELAGSYTDATLKLHEKYKISVYHGTTGLLSAAEMGTDKNTGSLFISNYGYNPIALIQYLFSVKGLDVARLGPFDLPKPRMFENIGLVKDITGRMAAVVRVIDIHKASEPEGLDQYFRIKPMMLGDDEEKPYKYIYFVRDKVTEDLEKLAAMKITGQRANELLNMIKQDGWEKALLTFNKFYTPEEKLDIDDPNYFHVTTLSNISRIPSGLIQTTALQNTGDVVRSLSVEVLRKEKALRESLYSLIPPDANSVKELPIVFESKPDMSWYCLKSLSINRFKQDEYETVKSMQVFKEEIIQSQSLAAVHCNPQNILTRMRFRPAEKTEYTADSNEPVN